MQTSEFIKFSSRPVNISGLSFAQQIPFHWNNRKKELTDNEKDLICVFIQKRFSKAGYLSYTGREFIRDHAECYTRKKDYRLYIANNHLIFTNGSEKKAFKI